MTDDRPEPEQQGLELTTEQPRTDEIVLRSRVEALSASLDLDVAAGRGRR